MISDVLFEARLSIEEYQKNMPECYEGIRDKIEHVKREMQALQELLDAPPKIIKAETRQEKFRKMWKEGKSLAEIERAIPKSKKL